MGWFGSGKAEKPNATSREDRSKCWEARDAYFSCLDAAEVVVAGTEGSKCAGQRKLYEQNCAKSWVGLPFLNRLRRNLSAAKRSTISTSVAC
jgi:cytochrome c oxidase assembly factor 6